jgi:hypothetical protein
MRIDELRCKRIDGTPVLWRSMKTYGVVTRVARDGSWADMQWWKGPPCLGGPPVGYPTWRKRQPLKCLEVWEHG